MEVPPAVNLELSVTGCFTFNSYGSTAGHATLFPATLRPNGRGF
jgi:hypothetical protein